MVSRMAALGRPAVHCLSSTNQDGRGRPSYARKLVAESAAADGWSPWVSTHGRGFDSGWFRRGATVELVNRRSATKGFGGVRSAEADGLKPTATIGCRSAAGTMAGGRRIELDCQVVAGGMVIRCRTTTVREWPALAAP